MQSPSDMVDSLECSKQSYHREFLQRNGWEFGEPKPHRMRVVEFGRHDQATYAQECSVGMLEVQDRCPIIGFILFESACRTSREVRKIIVGVHGQVEPGLVGLDIKWSPITITVSLTNSTESLRQRVGRLTPKQVPKLTPPMIWCT